MMITAPPAHKFVYNPGSLAWQTGRQLAQQALDIIFFICDTLCNQEVILRFPPPLQLKHVAYYCSYRSNFVSLAGKV